MTEERLVPKLFLNKAQSFMGFVRGSEVMLALVTPELDELLATEGFPWGVELVARGEVVQNRLRVRGCGFTPAEGAGFSWVSTQITTPAQWLDAQAQAAWPGVEVPSLTEEGAWRELIMSLPYLLGQEED